MWLFARLIKELFCSQPSSLDKSLPFSLRQGNFWGSTELTWAVKTTYVYDNTSLAVNDKFSQKIEEIITTSGDRASSNCSNFWI